MNRSSTIPHGSPLPDRGEVAIPGNRDSLWRFAALGVLLLLPPVFLLGDGDVTGDDIVIAALALPLSAIVWLGVAMLWTIRVEVTPDALALHGLTMRDRTIARNRLERIHAERRATLSRGVFWASPQLHVALSGHDAAGEAIELRLSGMMLDTERLLVALAPWIDASPNLVQDDATREAVASLGIA